MIHFVHPEAFLLAVPVVLLLRRRLFPRGLVAALRLTLLFCVLALLAEPFLASGSAGRDLILLVDRSLSVAEEHAQLVQEVAARAAKGARPGDRVGVVAFGRDAVVEAPPAEGFRPAPLARRVDRDGTDLAAAIETGLALIPPGRPGSLVLLSDGEGTGRDPTAVARECLRRGVRIDVFPLRRSADSDLAVEEPAVPPEVGVGEPFQFSAWVRSERAVQAPFRLLRDGQVIAAGNRLFHAGRNRLLFRDRLAAAGVHRYEVQVDSPGDRVPENDRALALVRAAGPFRVLCVTPQGRADRLTRSLAAAGLDVVVAAAERAPLDADALDGFRAVILEDVPAGRLPTGALAALTSFVRDFGGGVLMTGGKASFGVGGYHRSELEEVLPVTMEVRQEQRKFGLALAIALDRSGSMAAPVPGGKTKMDLANRGACAAIELLGPSDSVAVIAVDSAPHVVVPLMAAADRGAICTRIRKIVSEGGGIFTSTAVHAAAEQVGNAPQRNRHLVIFADAADAEEPGDLQQFVPELVQAGITVSVIGLGRESDSDAAFLKDLARLGNGRCFFAADPADLPRVFAQETIQVARSSVVEEPTDADVLPDILAVAALRPGALPQIGGYSIAYRKPGAQVGAVTRDEQKAPLFSFVQSGLGRAAAFLGEADGPLSGGLSTWAGYGDFFATVVRWLAGNDASAAVFVELVRAGHEAVLAVEVEPGKESTLDLLRARIGGPDGKTEEVLLHRVAERRLEARVPLSSHGIHRAVVQVGEDRFVRAPPVTLPYSPEFAPAADPLRGDKTLERLARATGGAVEPPSAELFAGSRTSAGVTFLTRAAAWLALLLLLAEICVRRLHVLLPRVELGWLRRFARRRTRPHPEGASAAGSPRTQAAAGVDVAPPAAGAGPTGTDAAKAGAGIDSVLERARARAERRT